MSALGGTEDGKGPGGVFMLDHYTFEPLGAWEIDRGDQFLGYDFWWHYAHDVMITSEWGEPRQFENGVVPEELLGKKYGHRIHFWDLRRRKRTQVIDIGDEHQMLLELRPAHDPRKQYGFFGVVISVADLSASVWAWYREKETFKVKKIATIPAEPADPDLLPPALKPFKAVPPLVTDIDLSLDDRFLYVSCWGTGEMRQYDVSDPLDAKLTGTVQIGGIVRKAGPSQGGPAQGWSPDGGDLPRRQAGLFHQRPLQRLGRAVLSRRHAGVDGEARREAQRRDHGGSRLPRDLRRGARAPGQARGGRRFD